MVSLGGGGSRSFGPTRGVSLSPRSPLCAATVLNWFHHAEQRGELCPQDLRDRIAAAITAAPSGSPEVHHRSLAADGELRAEYEALVDARRGAMKREELLQVGRGGGGDVVHMQIICTFRLPLSIAATTAAIGASGHC